MHPDSSPPIGLVMFAITVPFLAVMAIFAMRYGMLAFKARMNVAANDQYQTLAQKMVAAQAETSASLATIRAQLADVSASLATVEKVLKQVG